MPAGWPSDPARRAEISKGTEASMPETTATLDQTFYRDLRKEYPRIDRGEGIYLWDTTGRRYIDGAGGMYVVNIGHGVSEIIEAMAAQARKVCFAHVTQFTSDAQIELCNRLAALAPAGFGWVWLVSGGSEATESALKLARQYHVERGNAGKHKIVARWHSYHGNTIGALSMSGTPARRKLYSPYLLNFPHIAPCYCYRCPYTLAYPACGVRCAEELEHVIAREGPESIAAFIAEPIVAGPLGMATPPPEYFRMVRQICDRHDILMIDDEVICGVGRTGRNFGIDHWGVVPDIIVTGKVVTGGYTPVGAVIAHERVHEALARGSGSFVHGYTYSGNPLSSAIGVAVLDYIQRHDLVARVAETGAYLFQRAEALRRLSIVGDIRGKGLLMGIELVADPVTARPPDRRLRLCERVVDLGFARGLILVSGAGGINGVAGDYVCLAPPYTITRAQVDETLTILGECLEEVSARA
jgi:adenosylmethionine-8-amino-7-oxononanoate aminotransferase